MKTKAGEECQCDKGGKRELTFKDMQMMFPEYPDALDAKQVFEMIGTSTNLETQVNINLLEGYTN